MSWFVKKDRRAATRHNYEGDDTWIRPEGSLSRECQVLDVSRTGVRLKVANAHSLPNTFILIMAKGCGGRLARLKWRLGTEVGAEFVKTESSAVSSSTTNAPGAKLSAPSSSTTNAPGAKLSAPSSSTTNAPGTKLSAASRSAATARQAVKPPISEGQKTEKLVSSLSSRPQIQEPELTKEGGAKPVDSTSGDKVKTEVNAKLVLSSGQVDRSDQEKNSEKRMDLSRLQKRLGPEHVALIDAVKDLDPESPHGRELASIIASLDESDKHRGTEPNRRVCSWPK